MTPRGRRESPTSLTSWLLARSLCPRVTPLWRFCPELWTNSLAGLGPYPREAIHSLAHLDSLSDVPGIALFVSERTLYILQNLAALAGATSLNSSDPESDEAWIIEAIWAVNINTGAEITLAVSEGGNEQVISPYGASVASVGRVWIGKITLPPGAFIKAYFWNCALNDDIYLYWHGYTVPLVA